MLFYERQLHSIDLKHSKLVAKTKENVLKKLLNLMTIYPKQAEEYSSKHELYNKIFLLKDTQLYQVWCETWIDPCQDCLLLRLGVSYPDDDGSVIKMFYCVNGISAYQCGSALSHKKSNYKIWHLLRYLLALFDHAYVVDQDDLADLHLVIDDELEDDDFTFDEALLAKIKTDISLLALDLHMSDDESELDALNLEHTLLNCNTVTVEF